MKWRKWNWRKWLDGFILAAKGIMLATREKTFWFGFIPAFFFFSWLINMLSSGFTKFDLFFHTPFPENLQIPLDSFLATFGVGRAFSDWLPVFAISLLQGILIGLIVLLWKKQRQKDSANLEKAGIITGLIALGAGCPTCGTTLLTPLIGAIFSTSSLAVTGAVSTIITWITVIIAVLSLKRLGEENYVIIKNDQYLARKQREAELAKSQTSSSRSKSKKSTNRKETHE